MEQQLSSSQMKHSVMTTPLFSLIVCAIFLLFLPISILKISFATILPNETDKLALLEFKPHINSPLSVLVSWNESFHFCQWVGVTCGNKHQRVIGLDLQNKKLLDTISPHISFLQSLDLASNSFHVEFPPVGYFKMTYFLKILISKDDFTHFKIIIKCM